jgi:hypothetical protein
MVGWETPTLLGPLERANLSELALSSGPNRVGVSQPLTLEGKEIQFPKRNVLHYSSEYLMMDEAQKPHDPK